jgi:hypothetical protein
MDYDRSDNTEGLPRGPRPLPGRSGDERSERTRFSSSSPKSEFDKEMRKLRWHCRSALRQVVSNQLISCVSVALDRGTPATTDGIPLARGKEHARSLD